MDPLQVVAFDIIRQLQEPPAPVRASREEEPVGYRDNAKPKTEPVEEPKPAYYVVRATEQDRYDSYKQRHETVIALKHEKFDTLEEAQRHVETLVKGKFTKNDLCLLLYGYLAKPNVEVKTETITHINTTFNPV